MSGSVIEETITRVLAAINAISAGGLGWTRPSYDDLESAAHAVVEREAQALELKVWRDAAGNLYARMAGTGADPVPLYVGSHLDTVSEGGAYDGQAGVVGALALLAELQAGAIVPPMDIVLIVTRAEESVWFPVSYIGSRAVTGQLAAHDLKALRSDTGRSLADRMRDQGCDPDAVLTFTPPDPARFVEFHIEQGPVLDAAREPYAIVTAIRGALRYRQARISGVWAHSGGAPRGNRADCVMAFADLAVAMDRFWGEVLMAGDDLTVTFGRVDAAGPQHAMAKVPGMLDFCLDLRSADIGVLARADAHLATEIARIEAERPGIRFDLGAQTRSQPASLSPAMVDFMAQGAARLGDTPRRMLSGGGHDAAAFAAAGWHSVMVFIRNWDGSHNPDEGMDPADLARAVRALHAAITGTVPAG